MAGVRADQLDAATRKRLGIDGPGRGRTRAKPSRAEAGDGPVPGVCRCGQEFASEGRWEKHHDEMGPGHGRFDISASLMGHDGSPNNQETAMPDGDMDHRTTPPEVGSDVGDAGTEAPDTVVNDPDNVTINEGEQVAPDDGDTGAAPEGADRAENGNPEDDEDGADDGTGSKSDEG